MNGRYRNNSIRTINKTGNRVYSSTIIPDFINGDIDIEFSVIKVEYGDRLDLIAKRYYDDSKLWWVIARANSLTDFFIEEGVQLRIPRPSSISKILRKMDELNGDSN